LTGGDIGPKFFFKKGVSFEKDGQKVVDIPDSVKN